MLRAPDSSRGWLWHFFAIGRDFGLGVAACPGHCQIEKKGWGVEDKGWAPAQIQPRLALALFLLLGEVLACARLSGPATARLREKSQDLRKNKPRPKSSRGWF